MILSLLSRAGAALLAWTLAAGPVWALSLEPQDDGVKIEAGPMGSFTVSYPELDGGAEHKVISRTPGGAMATIQYEGGTSLQVDAHDPGQIIYNFTGLPADVKQLKVSVIIDFSYQQGGKWKIDGMEGTFPAEKPPEPHLFGGNATTFTLTDAQGHALSLRIPDYGYLELTDNREWNWGVYGFQAHFPVLKGVSSYRISVSSSGEAGAQAGPIIDDFGQIKAGEWPGKIHSADELKADAANEAAYYASFTPPPRDAFGGLPGTKEKLGLAASGFFHVEQKGAKWILVDPAGNAFFHLGICGFSPGDDYTLVAGRESAFAWLPPLDGEFHTAYKPGAGSSVLSFYLANRIRKYGTPYALDDFQAGMIDRVRRFGFNSIGAFSPVVDAVVQARNFPYVAHLPLGQYDLAPLPRIPGIVETWDPFDPANVVRVEKNFAAKLPGHSNDPLLIGYFLVNEPLYEDIPKVVPGLPGSKWACKRELVRELAAKYGTIAAFNAAWGVSSASFEALDDMPLPVTTSQAAADMHDFTGVFFEAYFKLVADAFHKYDPHHMLIGNRLQPGTINNEQLCRVAGRYLDIMSFNYYTDAVDRDFLKRIYGWTGRPMILSEFYWSAPRESGLVGGREVATERDRGLAYRNYLEQSAALGFVVGTEWFTLVDQASTGRWFSGFSGERGNTGVFAVSDRPYRPMVAEMAKAHDEIYDVWLGGKAPFAFDDPKFSAAGPTVSIASAAHATGPIIFDGSARNWPGLPPNVISGKRLVMGSESGGVEGAFKVCWDEDNLYLLVDVVDPTPMRSRVANDALWSGDAVEVFLGTEKLDQGGALLFTDRHLLIGAPGPGPAPYHDAHTPVAYPVRTLIVPGVDARSYTVEAAIPWTALGLMPQPGDELLFDLGIDDSTDGTARRAQLMWNGSDKNSGDRTHWGRLKLLR